MSMSTDQAIIGVNDILTSFFELFKEVLNEARAHVSDKNYEDPVVEALRPEEWPPPEESEELREPWTTLIDESSPEEMDLPETSAFAEPLRYLSQPWDEARLQYEEMFTEHVNPEFFAACPDLRKFLLSDECIDVFLPKEWTGLKLFKPLELKFKEGVPNYIRAAVYPVNPILKEKAQAEFERLKGYFYEASDSTTLSPMVIAKKATAPFIRLVIDCREINKWIEIAQRHIPHVLLELAKAAKFSHYTDLDMTNSFHQIRLGRKRQDT